MKLRTHLIILVVAALLPVLIFAGVMLVTFSAQQRSAVERGLVDTARALSLAVDRELAVSIRTLEQLATSEHLDSGELRKFYDQASRTLKIQPSWEAILLIDPFGQQVINLRVPFGTPLPETGASQLNKDVIGTGQPAISNLFTGAIVKGPLIAIAVPVVRDGKVKYVLASSTSPAFLLKLLAQQNVPSDWLATIIDGNQVIIARTRDFEKFVGKPAGPRFAAKSREAQEGVLRGSPQESAPAYTGFHRSELSGWTVGLAIPASVVESPLRRSLFLAAAGGLALLLLGIALAALFGHRVTASVGALCGSAVALGRGETPQRRHSRIVELNEVGDAIETAAATRKRAEEEIRRLAKFPAENPNPVMRIGRNGTILYANQSSAPILTTWEREVGQNVPDSCQKGLAAAFESGISKEMEIKCDGRIFSCIVTPILAEGYLNIYGQDITERMKADQALQESGVRYRSLFENMLDGYAYCRMLFEHNQPQDFIYLDVNSAFEKLTGLKNVVGRKVTEVIPGLRESHPELFEIYGRVALTGQPERFELYLESLAAWLTISAYSIEKGCFVAVFDNVTERKQAEEALRQYANRLATLSRRLIEVQETERQHLARELHDEIGQALTAVSINLQGVMKSADPSSLKSRIKESLQIIARSIDQVRNLSFELRPAILDDLGLVPAIRSYVGREAKRGGFKAKFNFEPFKKTLTPEVETACFRILQEAVTNVIRHARAGAVRVELIRQGDDLKLGISDDGVGFNLGALKQKGLADGSPGLVGMEERAALAGGVFKIDSSKGAGTRIEAVFPHAFRASEQTT